MYLDPKNIVELAIEGGCNAVASTFGVLEQMSRRYAHRIPFIVKINHNELLTFPNTFDQIMFGSVQQAYDLGAAGVGATIYFGSDESDRQIQEVAEAFEEAHAASACSPCSGATCATTASRSTASTTTTSADLTARRTTSA